MHTVYASARVKGGEMGASMGVLDRRRAALTVLTEAFMKDPVGSRRRQGVSAYLEASSDRSRRLYERHGCTDLGPPIGLPDGPTLRPMWRDPRNTPRITKQAEEFMTTDRDIIAGGPRDFMTVRRLTLAGSQAEIGRSLAAEATTAYGWAPVPADPVLSRARRTWFERHWPQHLARTRGAARAAGLDPDTEHVHLDALSGAPTGSGCSATWIPPTSSADGRAYLGRNYDFFTVGTQQLFATLTGAAGPEHEPPMASRPYVITSVPDDGPTTTCITMNELDGCMEGVNEHGLAIALLIADAESAGGPVDAGPQVGISSVQLPRFVLDTCRNVEEAKQALLLAKQYDLGLPLHYLIADSSGAAFVWERGAGGVEHIIIADGALCVTNHLLHRHPDASRLPVDNAETMRTYDRAATLTKRTTDGALSKARLRETLDEVSFSAANSGDYPIRTLWSTIIDASGPSMTTRFYLGDDSDGNPRYSADLVFTPTAAS